MDSPQASDVFSLSDHLLAERLQFVKEIGFGNWGSVWLCHPKSSSGKARDIDVAVKLVHRSKTSTTAARVRSLWNEMKIVRSFKNDPHPSIVPFHSFIITPSYALITMAYLPTPVPVEVSEARAKGWFKSLLSGVHFLHSRGVVHNDIKPANILLSPANAPVLVDFGFAEKYDLDSPKAFHSNLTYGTPEYLSPERARGLPHDTRKSDVWSLGVTFFEIIVGRTPFEYEEGEVFEKKEDLEKYWSRTMRGKWVGKYSMSQPVERFLKRMIVPNVDLRCTAAEIMGDAYWDANPATSISGHKKPASAAVLSSVPHPQTHSSIPSVRDSFKDKEKDKGPSPPRRFDISLPWSPSRSTSRSSTSHSASKTESTSRSASRLGPSSRPTSRAESSPRTASVTSSSQHRVPGSPSEGPVISDRGATEEQPSSISASSPIRIRTHSRSKSQPKLRTPPGISTAVHTRKLSTVQASPIIKPQRQIGTETDSDETKEVTVPRGQGDPNAHRVHALLSLNSNSSLRRPLGPRQPSPRIIPTLDGMKVSPVSSRQLGSSPKKRLPSHHVQSQTREVDQTRLHSPSRLLITPNIPHTPTHTVTNQISSRTPRTSHQASVSKQLSGRPPRTRGRAGVLADLTGLARNVDLGAHGVEHPVRHGREKKDRGRENKSHANAQKENKENEVVSPQIHISRKDTRPPSRLSGPIPRTPVKQRDTSTASILLAVNLPGAMTITKGSVRDRMMDWERERERLRETVRMTDTSTEGHGDRDSTILTRTSTGLDSSDDDSGVEAEVAAEVASAQAKRMVPAEDKGRKQDANTEDVTTTTMQTRTSIYSLSSSHLEKSQIEVAKLGVRASAQILSSHNGSVSALGLIQRVEKRPSQESSVKNDTVTDIGLPVETRNGESGFTSLKHSVKASIDKGVRFYKSSTLGQLTGRNTPVWAPSPEPIDFEQRRSGEEGRFSWENIRPEHEVALDRMNLWIQSVEKVVEETCQNFASTSVTPPAPLPLSPTSRSSSYHGTLNTPASTSHTNNHSFNTGRRRLLAANEIFAEPADMNASLSPASPSRGEDPSTSSSHIHAPESSMPYPSINMLIQTPRRRRATISTRSPAQAGTGSAANNTFDCSPSKRREKSKSQSNLDMHIKDVAKLELELSRVPITSPSPKLSAVLDRNLFVKPPLSPRLTEDSTVMLGLTCNRSTTTNGLNSPPHHAEPYSPRKAGEQGVLHSHDRQRLEGVYDRFLMATSGVKRVGKGYQSDHLKLVPNTSNAAEHAKASHARGFGVFGTGKRPMPPPVSSDDACRRSTSIDELGFTIAGQGTNTSPFRTCRDESKSTFVRRAIKAMVPGKTASRRLSRTIVV